MAMQDDLKEIKEDISEIKMTAVKQQAILEEHIRRTEALETLVKNQDSMFARFERMDAKNKAFVYKVLIGAVVTGLLPFLVKILL